MTLKMRSLAAGALCLLLAPVLPAQAADPAELTLEQIMADPDWLGNPPENPYWADDGRAVYYERERDGGGRNPRDLFRVDLATGKTSKVEAVDRGKVDALGGAWSRDHKKKVWARQGDIFFKDLVTGTVRQITRTAEAETEPFLLVDGKRIGFYQDNQVFLYDLATGLLSQPADLRLTKDPAKMDEPSYLAAQQTRLFDVIRQQQEQEKRDREERLANQKADSARAPLPWYLGKGITIEAVRLSPSGDWLAVITSPKRGEGDLNPAKMPVYVTESGYVETRDVRSKVGGEAYVPHSVILLDLVKHERHDLDLTMLPGIKEDPLKALREAAAEKKKAAMKKDGEPAKEEPKAEPKDEAKKEAEPRPVEIAESHWSDDGKQLALAIRARDNKDRWIATFDTGTGAFTSRDRLTDAAWINWNFNEFGWLRDNETLWLLSEETGFSGLYLLPLKSGEKRLLTPPGRYEVSAPVLSRDGRTFYYSANQEHPGKNDAWRVDVATGKAEQLTRLGGLTDVFPSPDEKQLLILHSGINRPNELYVQANRPGAEAKQYPAVMFVHGAGYLQNVHFGWSNYFREFMFHTLLTRHGYVVIDMDYRASAGYGRDWRTAIYRQMGTPELEDMQDGVSWLVANKAVDSKRVGVYGGSYGGFMTYMALFRAPDLFAAGAALRPVSDWAHYNEEYTSNILNRPEDDPEAYEKSSPIEYAAGLQKPLLICDGMLDSNVFFQDNVRLVQRLIELKKENFELAVYPVEDHGFVQPTSWLDEYRRIFKLFETHLK